MATPLTDAINALTTYANTVTGASDTTLSDAVGTLAAGYGGGGGGVTAATGTFTLASNFSLTTSAQEIPGLQLSFVPDLIFIMMERDSFEALTAWSSTLFGLLAIRKSIIPPQVTASNVTADTASGTHAFLLYYTASASTASDCGYAIDRPSVLSNSYYARYGVNNDGTVSVGRWSSASGTKMQKGTYRYFAIKL